MNIFATSDDPFESAICLDDKRVVKMCLETAQLLSTNIRQRQIDFGYKPTHVKHPCNLWLEEGYGNFLWLYKHGVQLCLEYERRFSKHHKSEEIIRKAFWLRPNDGTSMTAFKNCTIFKDEPVHKAYKDALIVKWNNDTKAPKWSKTNPPEWYRKD
jgi:hypothetical protein